MVTRARLRRRTEQRLVAGVAGGIADRLNASVGFVRVFVGIAAAFAPWTIGLYAVAALLIPPRGSDRPDWDNLIALTRVGLVLGVPVVVLGKTIVNDPLEGPAGWWIAYDGLVAAGGVALLTADYRRGRARTRSEARALVLAAVPVGASFLALALAMLVAPDIRWERFLPAAALVGAATVLVAARRDRTGAFLAPALLAVAVAGIVTAGNLRLQGGLGDTRVTPSATGGEPIVARRAVGDLTLDLRHLKRRAATVEATVGVGTLRVFLPRGAPVELDARVGKGQIDPWLMSSRSALQGFDQRVRRDLRSRPYARPTAPIRLKADVGLGEIHLGHVGDTIEGES